MVKSPLTLSEAREKGLLKKFVTQEEARGMGPAASKQFERLAEAVIRSPRSEDQTSHSRYGDD